VIEVSEYKLETLRKDGEFILYRGERKRETRASAPSILAVTAASERPTLACLRRMEHEYSLRAELDPAWAAIPLALTRHEGRTTLVLKDPRGEPLDQVLKRGQGQPLDLNRCLRNAMSGTAWAEGRVVLRYRWPRDVARLLLSP
jgi:hypothetical protein